MQRLRLTEDFALDIGDSSVYDMTDVPLHKIASGGVVHLLNADGAETHNVREYSSVAQNTTYQVPTYLTPDSYTDTIVANFADSAYKTTSLDKLQYLTCRLYAVSGFRYASNVIGVWLRLSIDIDDVKYSLMSLLDIKARSLFTPVKNKIVVIDNEQFTTEIEFKIVDIDFLCSMNSDEMSKVREFVFGTSTRRALQSNINVEIGLVYDDKVYSFEQSLVSGAVRTFTQFALREIKQALLLTGNEDETLYADVVLRQESEYAPACIEMQMKHRTMQLSDWISRLELIDDANVTYDVILQAYNAEGSLIDSSIRHMQFANVDNATQAVEWAPIIVDDDNPDNKPKMALVYVTAVLDYVSTLGQVRISRSMQLILSEDDIAMLCWHRKPQIKFESYDIVHKVINQKTVIGNAKAGVDRILQIDRPMPTLISKLVINDDAQSLLVVKTINCPKGSSVDISIALLDTDNAQIALQKFGSYIARSGNNIVRDELIRTSNYIRFTLPNNEGSSTTWDIMDTAGNFLQRIVLSSVTAKA